MPVPDNIPYFNPITGLKEEAQFKVLEEAKPQKKVVKTRKRRCRKCEGCNLPDCGVCKNCTGRNVRQFCKQRVCQKLLDNNKSLESVPNIHERVEMFVSDPLSKVNSEVGVSYEIEARNPLNGILYEENNK